MLLGPFFVQKNETFDFDEKKFNEWFDEFLVFFSSIRRPNNVECCIYKVTKQVGMYFSILRKTSFWNPVKLNLKLLCLIFDLLCPEILLLLSKFVWF